MQNCKRKSFRPLIITLLVIFALIIIVFFVCSFNKIENNRNLPVIHINTEDSQPVLDTENYIQANIKITDKDSNNSNYSTDTLGGKIKGRGNTTWRRFKKKPYKIKLQDKENLLGMPECKTWALLANSYDSSYIRTELMSTLSHALGFEYTMKSKPVVLYLNNEYQGLYTLIETIDVGKNRINVTDIEKINDETKDKYLKHNESKQLNSVENLLNNCGGFILDLFFSEEINSVNPGPYFISDKNQGVEIKAPDEEFVNESYKSDIQIFYQLFENAVLSENFKTVVGSEEVRYNDLCDIHSLAQYWIAMQVSCNIDCYFMSNHFYKDYNQKMKMGPVWDFDKSFGNEYAYRWESLFRTYIYDLYPIFPEGKLSFITNLVKDPYFLCISYNYYLLARPYLFNLTNEGGLIDSAVNKICTEAIFDRSYWAPNSNLRYNNLKDYDIYIKIPLSIAVEQMKNFMNKRIDYLEETFSSFENLTEQAKLDNSKLKVTSLTTQETTNFIIQPNISLDDLKTDLQNQNVLNVEINGRVISSINTSDLLTTCSGQFTIDNDVIQQIAYEDNPASDTNSNFQYSEDDGKEAQTNPFIHDKSIKDVNNYYLCLMLTDSNTSKCVGYYFFKPETK